VYLKDGLLHLRAVRERLIDTLPFTSGNVFSSIEFGKGHYFEVRCKIPKGRGLWPAFWFWSGRNAKYQEIDVLEYWCDDTRRFSIANYWQDSLTQKVKSEWKWIRPRTEDGKRLDMSEQFATYSVFWDDDGVRFLLNNRLVAHIKNNLPPEPFPIILNLAVDSGKGRDPNDKTIFPAEFLIDYVRVYKRKGTQTITRQP
jgi:beta-glucanase (GH16 family)